MTRAKSNAGTSMFRCCVRPYRFLIIIVVSSLFVIFIQRNHLFTRLLNITKQKRIDLIILSHSVKTIERGNKIQSTSKPVKNLTTSVRTVPKCIEIHSELSSVNKTKHGIPYIIHQIYKDIYLPEQYIRLMQGCQKINSDFIHVLWTDKDAIEFLKHFYPDKISLFNKYSSGVQKSDFLRLLLLYHFGGVYIDMDVECIQPFSTTLDRFNSSCILDREREMQTRILWDRQSSAMNSALMSRSKHPFIKFLLEMLPKSLRQKHVMWRTGPFFMDDRLKDYNKNKHSPNDSVLLAPSSAFSPLIDPIQIPSFNKRCKSALKKPPKQARSPKALGCIEWFRQGRREVNAAERVKNAILVHRFLHLAYTYNKKKIKKRVNVCGAMPNLKRFSTSKSLR